MPALAPLRPFRGRNRLLVLLAPALQSPAYQAQLDQFNGVEDACRERDLLLGHVFFDGQSRVGTTPLDAAGARDLRAHFGVKDDDFMAILVGKDGTEKRRYSAPVAARAVFEAIDAMPMRQQEMEGDA